jgi:adenylate cyclase
MVDVRPLVDWMLDGARSAAESQDVLAELCDRMVIAGIPLYRVAVFVRTLHPQVMGRRFIWKAGQGVAVSAAPYETLSQDIYLKSPFVAVYTSGVEMRRRLVDPDCVIDFQAIQEVKDEGVTDYLASPLVFTNNEVHVVTWTTRDPAGFTDEQIAGIRALVNPLARVAEIRALRRTASNFLETYIGKHASQRVLGGKIRLGETEAIHAAVWLSDMRGSTALADRLSPQRFIDLLNAYFECQVTPIVEHGGEVLKYIGDGLLAIFPVGDDDAGKVCSAALVAAQDARERVAALAKTVAAEGIDLRFGMALHIGEVMYGNIGAGNRLDFTCIGPAVNLAARIESLTGRLGRTVLASQEFVGQCSSGLVPVGDFKLLGFSAAHRVFGLPGETSLERAAS